MKSFLYLTSLRSWRYSIYTSLEDAMTTTLGQIIEALTGNNLDIQNYTPQSGGQMQWKTGFWTQFAKLHVFQHDDANNHNGPEHVATIKGSLFNKHQLAQFGKVYGIGDGSENTDSNEINHGNTDGFLSFEPVNSQPQYQKQCVALIQGGTNPVVSTTNWIKSSTQAYNSSLPVYSIIATFNSSNKYNGHVGLYISTQGGKMYILSQNWRGTAANAVGGIDIRRLSPSGSGVKNAMNYYLVNV